MLISIYIQLSLQLISTQEIYLQKMLRKISYKFIQLTITPQHFAHSTHHLKTQSNKYTNLIQSITSIKRLYGNSFTFSTMTPKETDNQKTNKQSNEPQNEQNVETIQVSLQEFRQMKQLLQQLKAEMSTLQQQQHQPLSQTKKESPSISSPVSEQLQKESSQLFFQSQEQQLSFQLIKLHAKQQFSELAELYLNKFNIVKNVKTQSQHHQQQISQHLKLLYLIFYRYICLENTKIDDPIIKDLLLQITSHADILEESELEKLLSILNDQVKQREAHPYNSHASNFKMNSILQQNFHQLVNQVKANLLKDNKVFNYKLRTNKNSQILSLLHHFFTHKQLAQTQNQLTLQKFSIEENESLRKEIIYNPSSISHLLVDKIKHSQTQSTVQSFYELIVTSLSINEKQFTNLQTSDQKYQLEQSLRKMNPKQFSLSQFQGIIYFLQNCPSEGNQFLKKVSNFLFSNTNYIQKFTLIQQLRLCYSFLINPQFIQPNSTQNNQVLSEIQRILLSPQNQEALLQYQKQSIFQSNEDQDFIHLIKLAMILSQIGIQLFKNYRMLNKQNQTMELRNKLQPVIVKIIRLLNQVCLQKIDFKEMFKEEQIKQIGSQKLILNLNLFQFIVNLNILSKWISQLSGDSSLEELNTELLQGLISLFFGNTLKTMTQAGPLTEQRKLGLAQEMIIFMLIGKQKTVISKVLQFYFGESQNSYIFINLIRGTIGQNTNHKYYQQYLKLSQEFNF